MSDNGDWTQYVEQLPPRVRQNIAAARNTQIRVSALRQQMTEEGKKLKTQVRRLNAVEGLNPHLLGRCLGISRSRVLEILGKK